MALDKLKKLSQLNEQDISNLKRDFRESSIEVLQRYLDDSSISVLIYVFERDLKLQINRSRQIKKINRLIRRK